jgi:hypothetical protein
MSHDHNFSRRMEAAQRQAKIARNAGRHVGASAKGWDWKRPDDDPSDFAAWARRAREQLALDIRTALNDYQAAILNMKHREDFNDCPF